MNTSSITPDWLDTGHSTELERPLAGKAVAITTNGAAEVVR